MVCSIAVHAEIFGEQMQNFCSARVLELQLAVGGYLSLCCYLFVLPLLVCQSLRMLVVS